MIHFCTCTGGAASTLGPSEKKAASCKTCGGKPLVDGRGHRSISMLSTVGFELASLINSDLTWKKVTKGNRSASRRARKSVTRSLKASGELVDKDSRRVDMPVSESEKLGVTVLGCRFSEKAEHVPIKKRKIFFRSPSPPHRTPSPQPKETERLTNSQRASDERFSPDVVAKSQPVAIDAGASGIDLGQVFYSEIDADGKKLVKVNEQLGDNDDFSGISILAAAACSNSVGQDDGLAAESSGVEESFVHGVPLEVVNNDSCCLVKGPYRVDLGNPAEISTERTGCCISAAPAEELAVPLRTHISSSKVLGHGSSIKGTGLQDDSAGVSKDLLSKKNNATIRTHEFSLRDDRSHWDLNTVMDAWEHPFDSQYVDSQTNVADGISEDAESIDDMGKSEGSALQTGPGNTRCDVEETLLPTGLREVAHETQELNVEEHKLGVCTGVDTPACLPKKLGSSEIDSDLKMDPVKETESFYSCESICLNAESVVFVPVGLAPGPSVSASVDKNASAQCVTFDSTGSSETRPMLQVDRVNSCADYSLSPKLTHPTSTCVPEGNCNAAFAGLASFKNVDDSAADTQTGDTICPSSLVEKQEVASLVAFSKKDASLTREIVNENGEDAEENSGLHDDGNVAKNLVGVDTSQAGATGSLDNLKVNVVCKSDEVSFAQPSLLCLGTPASGGEFSQGHSAVAVDTEGQQHDKVIVHDFVETDIQVHIDAEADEPATKSSGKSALPLGTPSGRGSHDACGNNSDDLVNGSNNVALEEPFDDASDSDMSREDHGPADGPEKISELQVDYDSQYEDGELRESIVHTWEEYDGEEGEAEHVDYGSDNKDMYSFDECTRQRLEDSKYLGSEAEELTENGQETDFKNCQGGSLITKVIEAGSHKERAVKTSPPCLRAQNAGKGAIEEFDMHTGLKLDKESAGGPDKMIMDHEILERDDNAKESSLSAHLKMKMSGLDQLSETRNSSSDATAGVRDGSGRKKISGHFVERLDAEDTETGMGGSRAFRRELRPHVDGRASRGVFLRKDRLCMQGNRIKDANDSHPRSDRESSSAKSFGRDRYFLHFHARGQGGDHWTDSPEGHKGLKHHHSPSCHGQTAFHRPGAENASAVAAKVENNGFVGALNVKSGGVGFSGHAGRCNMNVSSHGVLRHISRSGSPADREEAFGMRMGIRSAGETSPDRGDTVGRGRSVRYGPRADGRGSRRRYHGPLHDDCIESSFNHSHVLARRERSFSPIGRRGDPHRRRSCTKSPSRSRTRSPVAWQSPRGRNGAVVGANPFFRRRSRSPNFKSGPRLVRARSPHQRPGFVGDHLVEFMSMPRTRHGSPPHSRWVADRMDGVVHFREQGYRERSLVSERRSPGRICPRGNRFDLVDTSRKLKPNEYCRSIHSGRFSEMDGVGRGGLRYEGSGDDDRRKHGYRYGLVHPVRRYNVDGSVKRFHYDIDGFVVAHSPYDKDSADFHGKGSPRRSREERDPFAYRRDGKYNINSKSFGTQECDEDTAPRRRRPS